MEVLNIKAFERAYKAGKTQVTITYEGKPLTFRFAAVAVGYGTRHYFICPHCGRNCAKLVFNGYRTFCLRCSSWNPYEGIQCSTRGGSSFIMYKMKRFAAKHGIQIKAWPFSYFSYPCPKGKHCEKWRETLKRLQALESMRAMSIFFGKVWDAATIRSIEDGTNRFLVLGADCFVSYFYPFDDRKLDTSRVKGLGPITPQT